MLNQSATTLGNKSQGCPEIRCYDTCSVCEHKNYVFENSTPLSGQSNLLLAVIESVLTVHEEYIQCLCDYEQTVCQRGEVVGFPCMQCGFINPDCISYGEPIFLPEQCSECPCFRPVMFDNCEIMTADVSVVLPDVYPEIVNALEELSGGFANGSTMESFFQKFLPESNLLFFKDSTYHFSLGNADNSILSILPLLINIAPVPFGARVLFYINCEESTVLD